jgi:hypothetical protein
MNGEMGCCKRMRETWRMATKTTNREAAVSAELSGVAVLMGSEMREHDIGRRVADCMPPAHSEGVLKTRSLSATVSSRAHMHPCPENN